MLEIKKIHEDLLKISTESGLPVSHKDDLVTDFEILKEFGRANSDFIWILRQNGTVMVPIRRGIDPYHIKHWATYENECYLITKGEVRRISHTIAHELADEEPFNPNHEIFEMDLVKKVRAVLDDHYVRSSVFDSVGLSSEPYTWESWQAWFKDTENKMMANWIRRCNKRYETLMQYR